LEGADPSHPVASDYKALFAVDLIAKDLALAGALAEEQGVSVPLAEAALAAYRAAQAGGLGHLDYSAVYLSTAPAP